MTQNSFDFSLFFCIRNSNSYSKKEQQVKLIYSFEEYWLYKLLWDLLSVTQ